MRLFIAVELPDEIKQNIEKLIVELKGVEGSVRWVETDNLHLTLKFLGEVAAEKKEGLLGWIEEKAKGTGNFKIELRGTGTFPEGKHPKVIWVGVESGSEQLAKLAQLLGEKEFVAHVTIGRIKNDKGVDQLQEKLAELKDTKFGAAQVGSIFVIKSTLTPNGPLYEKIKEVKL